MIWELIQRKPCGSPPSSPLLCPPWTDRPIKLTARGSRISRSEVRWSLELERRTPTWTRPLHGRPPRIHYEGRGSPAAQKWQKKTYPCRDDRSQIPWSDLGSRGTFQDQRRCVLSRSNCAKHDASALWASSVSRLHGILFLIALVARSPAWADPWLSPPSIAEGMVQNIM